MRVAAVPSVLAAPRRLAALLTLLAVALPSVAVGTPDTPVADAAMRGEHEQLVALLREGADVNAAQGDGMTALHWAARRGDVETIATLLYAGAVIEPSTRLGGYTPLHLAAQAGRAAAVIRLLEAGADAVAPTTAGAQPIHLAAAAGSAAAVEALLAHGAEVDAPDERSARTPLMFAIADDRLNVVKTLLAAGADVEAQTRVVRYPERESADLVERRRRARLLAAAKEPQPEEEPEGGAPTEPVTPAGAATPTQGEPATPATTGQAEPAKPAPEADPDRPAAEPAEKPDPDRPDIEPAPEQDPDSPDTEPAPEDPAEPDHPTPPEPRPLSYTDLVGSQGGFTALHYAARDGRATAVGLLLESGAAIDRPTGGDASSPLLVATINGHYDLAMMLLELGADPNLTSEDGAAPLFAVLNHEWALRTWYPQPTAGQRQTTTYLELMEALLAAGADPNARVSTHIWYAAYNAGRMGVDFSGATAFWRAAYATDVEAMRLLVAYGADPNIPTTKPPRRRFPGQAEREEEDPSGLPPVPTGGPAVHPLHAASGVGYGTSRVGQQHRHVPTGWLPAVRYLVDELGVDVNVRDHDGYTALHNAAARGDNVTIEFLVSRGADVTLVSRRGQTTVDMANGPQQRVQPFPETIALLESYGAKNNNNCRSCD